MALERLDSVRGTARIITACRRKQVPKAHLIPAYEQDEECSDHVALGTVDGGVSAGGTGRAQRSSCDSTRLMSVLSCSKVLS